MEFNLEQLYSYLNDVNNLIILALTFLGIALKKVESIENRFIPAILLVAGMVSGSLLIQPWVIGMFKGAIYAGISVFIYELILKNIPFILDFVSNWIKEKLGAKKENENK